MTFNMIFTINNCSTYCKSASTVKSINNRQNFHFVVMKFRLPHQMKQPFLPNKKTLFKYSNIYLFIRYHAISSLYFNSNGVVVFRKLGVYRPYGQRSFPFSDNTQIPDIEEISTELSRRYTGPSRQPQHHCVSRRKYLALDLHLNRIE